jgi:hypothetical protein
MFLRPFGLYCSACFGSLFVSIICACCSHFFLVLFYFTYNQKQGNSCLSSCIYIYYILGGRYIRLVHGHVCKHVFRRPVCILVFEDVGVSYILSGGGGGILCRTSTCSWRIIRIVCIPLGSRVGFNDLGGASLLYSSNTRK